jgi:anti-sigma factor RsiW
MNQRDLELLSSYLDGQLRPSDSARLEARLSAEPDLRAVLEELRSTRSLLRQLPPRKAPRNFTLTPKMVGRNPPLPRLYPAFRFVTALATLLYFATVGLNVLAPQLASQAPLYGMGGGGAPEAYSAQAPAATEAPAMEAPAATEPSAALAPALPTGSPSAEDNTRQAVAPAEKNGAAAEPGPQSQAPLQNAQPLQSEVARPVPAAWQFLLAGTALLGVLLMVMMRRVAAHRWRQ